MIYPSLGKKMHSLMDEGSLLREQVSIAHKAIGRILKTALSHDRKVLGKEKKR